MVKQMNIQSWINRIQPRLPALTGSLALIMYLVTLIREPGWGDAAELSLAAYRLGPTHTPGYPVHSMLGKVLMLLIPDPGIATNLLSAIGASIGVAIISYLILQWTHSPMLAVLVPIQFALVKPIWDMAVIAEVYDFNLMFVALLIWLTLEWWKDPTSKKLFAVSVVYGISTGAFLANVFVSPAYLPMLWKEPKDRWKRLFSFAIPIGAIGLLLFGFTTIRSQVYLPLGTPYPPITFDNAIKFFTGYEASPFAIKSVQFYIDRTIAQALFFAESYLYVGVILGVWGFVVQWQKQRAIAIFLGLMFLCNMLFFTYYNGVDYLVQVIQSYLVFSLWIGVGADDLIRRMEMPRIPSAVPVGLIVIAMIAAQMYFYLPEKLARASSYEVTEFNLDSLNHFPENAVVFALWERYAALHYFQSVRDLRPDILIVERKGDLAPMVNQYSSARPIVFDADDALPGANLKPFYRRWVMLKP